MKMRGEQDCLSPGLLSSFGKGVGFAWAPKSRLTVHGLVGLWFGFEENWGAVAKW